MSDAPVVGSAAFELRATTDKLKSDLARAERETKAEMKKVEDAARHAQAELKRAFSDAGHSEFERSMRIIRNASNYTEDEVRAAAERVAKDLKGRYRDLGADIGQTFAGISRSAQLAFAAITAYSLKLAADAEEIEASFDMAFATGARGARIFSEALADASGRDAVILREQMTKLQLVLTGTGVAAQTATKMVEALTARGVDAGAMFNVSDAESLQKIVSGLTGETEPLKAFGVVISQAAVEAELLRLGFKGNASEADEAAKSIARANLIIEKLGVAEGRAATEADSATGKTRAMTAEFNKAARSLGQELLPAMTQVFGAATNVLKAFNDLPGGVQVAGLALLGLVAAGGPIAGVLAGLGKIIKLANDTRLALAGVVAGGAKGGAILPLAGSAALGAGLLVSQGSFAPAPTRDEAAVRRDLAFNRSNLARLEQEGASASRRQRIERRITSNLAELSRIQKASDAAIPSAPEVDTSVPGGFSLPPALLQPGGAKEDRRSGRVRTGLTEADIAAMREALDLQNALDLARASGNSAQIKALERKQELARLTADFERAGYEDAATKAQDHLKALDAIRDRSEQIADWEQKSLAFWEELGESVRRQNDLLLDRLGFEAEIARLEGDPDRIKERERELWIEQRINDLLSLRTDLKTDAERRSQAENEWQRLDTADQTGRMRDEFRYAFTDGIKAAIDGDLGGFFDNLADRFTTRMLDNLADDLFDLLTDAAKGMGKEGGGFWSSIASGIGSIFSFGGGRATGGAMSGGNWYRVGEHGPEDILMPRNGFAMPLGALASGGSGQAQVQRVQHEVIVRPERDSFIALSTETAAPLSAQAGVASYQASEGQRQRAVRIAPYRRGR
ncbi:hypothetical protein [Brevundimonas diminuta]|uniref:hypothetical protein n=2 Tax=Brevundimonas diminuta TaxID=293 RepID=UPI0028B0DEC7|nr:hypothetical protein [Brevundimonas diminuta]